MPNTTDDKWPNRTVQDQIYLAIFSLLLLSTILMAVVMKIYNSRNIPDNQINVLVFIYWPYWHNSFHQFSIHSPYILPLNNWYNISDNSWICCNGDFNISRSLQYHLGGQLLTEATFGGQFWSSFLPGPPLVGQKYLHWGGMCSISSQPNLHCMALVCPQMQLQPRCCLFDRVQWNKCCNELFWNLYSDVCTIEHNPAIDCEAGCTCLSTKNPYQLSHKVLEDPLHSLFITFYFTMSS